MTIPENPDAPARWRKSSHSNAGNNCVEVATWRKASYSTAGNNCVEVGQAGAIYAVRDSKNPYDGHLTFGPDAWQAFITDIKHRRYDNL